MSQTEDGLLERVLDKFPPEIAFAFAYGSAVYRQEVSEKQRVSGCPALLRPYTAPAHHPRPHQPSSSTNGSNGKTDLAGNENMLDLILAVDDPLTWHEENLKRNPAHYSFMRHLGPKFITNIQRSLKAKIYFNVVLATEEEEVGEEGTRRAMKYGVIHSLDLVEDLLKWETLYVSGRLHKPVHVLVEPRFANRLLLSKALAVNYKSALSVALLLLPERFSEAELYVTIAGLSYSGDFRMIVGEDKNKVFNIVMPQMERFRAIYEPLLAAHKADIGLRWDPHSETYTKVTSPALVGSLLATLPENVKRALLLDYNFNAMPKNLRDEQQLLLFSRLNYSEDVRRAITSIVWRSSLSQGIKGFFTTGFLKALQYCGRKLFKMYSSLTSKSVSHQIS